MAKLGPVKHIQSKEKLMERIIIREVYYQDASSTFSNKYAKLKILTKLR